jgi:CRP/FNR family transcriptional regulator, cyclic AMP receptor protein
MPEPANAREKAAHLLLTDLALPGLAMLDAMVVVDYMKPKRAAAGTLLMREGERMANGFMLLVLDGDVRVESHYGGDTEHMVLGVLGAGSLIGELALLDDAPRAATCIAASDMHMAILTREALEQIIEQHPAVAARLMLAISKRVADRLRETLRKFKSHVRVNKIMRQELDLMMMAQVSRAPILVSE